jgi:hypothetical protein
MRPTEADWSDELAAAGAMVATINGSPDVVVVLLSPFRWGFRDNKHSGWCPAECPIKVRNALRRTPPIHLRGTFEQFVGLVGEENRDSAARMWLAATGEKA